MAYSYHPGAPKRNIAVRLDLTADEFSDIAKAAEKLDMKPVEYIWHAATCTAVGLGQLPPDRLFWTLFDADEIETCETDASENPRRRRSRARRAA